MAEIPSSRRILPLRKKRSADRSFEEHVSPKGPAALQNGFDSTHDDHISSDNTNFTRSKTRASSSTATQRQHSCKDASTAQAPKRDDGDIAHNSSQHTYLPATATSPENPLEDTQCDKDDMQPKTGKLEASTRQIPSIILHDSNGTIINHSGVNSDGGENTSDASDSLPAGLAESEEVVKVIIREGDSPTKTNRRKMIDIPHETESGVAASSVELGQLSEENVHLGKRLGEPGSELNEQSKRIRELSANKRYLNRQVIDSQLVSSHKESINESPRSVWEVSLLRPIFDPHQPRCSATKVDNKRCGAKIKKTEKDKAFKILRAMDVCDDFDERTLAKEIESAVRLLTCKRDAHRRQANGIAARWAGILCQPVESSIKIEDIHNSFVAGEENLSPRDLNPPAPGSIKNEDIQIRFVAEEGYRPLRNLNPAAPGKYSHLSRRDHIKSIIDEPFKPTDTKVGYIYIYSVNSNFGLVKIGWTTDTPNERLRGWEYQCKRKLYRAYPEASKEMIKIPHAWRVEKLVHAELREYNKWEIGCGCKTKTHKEWFETSLPHAMKLVEFWSAWVQTYPYEERPGDWPEVGKATLPAWTLKESHKAELDSLLDKIEGRDMEQRERLQSPPLQRRARSASPRSASATLGSPAQNTRSASRRRELEQRLSGSPVRPPLQGRRAVSAPAKQPVGPAEEAKVLFSPDFMKSWKEEPIMTGSKKGDARK